MNQFSAARNRPRVAAIGLSDTQLAEIRPFCGNLRPAQSVDEYLNLQRFSWSETDIVVACGLDHDEIDAGVHVLTIGPMSHRIPQRRRDRPGRAFQELASMAAQNRERELAIAPLCPPMYRGPAEILTKELSSADDPPTTVTSYRAGEQLRNPIVETSSGRPVALRMQWADRPWGGRSPAPGVDVLALYLPKLSNLSLWFRAFLIDISEFDPQRVPQPPSLLGDRSPWYTPREDELARTITEIARRKADLESDQQRVEGQLARERVQADATVRRTIWEDGNDLVEAVGEMLEEMGFAVEKMDEPKQPHEAKHEDLRLTVADQPDWQAIVEVKGYTKGIKTNDAQQVRMHRDRYIKETGREPNLTIWMVNPYRAMEPSDRPGPDSNVDDTAKIVEAVCVLTTDLYRLWKSVKAGDSAQDVVVGLLVEAEAGLWRPSLNP